MIQSHNLTYRYPGASAALHFTDVNAAQGALVLLSGPSGCGKSTWLALIAALVMPSSGTLTVAGQDLTQLPRVATDAWRAHSIGFLPQKLHLSAALSVQQNLAMAQWAAAQPEDSTRIRDTLAQLGIAELAPRKPAQLSGGQAQRVALARAVLLEPKIILADEPTASLDDDSAHAALNLLLDTAQRLQATLVIATHDKRVAALIAGSTRANDCIAVQLQRVQPELHA